jgi:hypothetical protein
MSTFYDYDDDGNLTEDWEGNDSYNIHQIEEKIKQASSAMFKQLMEMAMIEDFIDDELMKKRIWCLRKQPYTITHYDIDHYMNKATVEEIDARVIELTIQLAEK